MNSFTYIIRSEQQEAGGNNDSCFIRLNGLPSGYSEYLVNVNFLNIEGFTSTSSFFELRTENIDFIDGFDSKFKGLRTIAFFNTSGIVQPHSFKMGNFNGRSIRFVLYDEDGVLSTINKKWVLSLNIQPIKDI